MKLHRMHYSTRLQIVTIIQIVYTLYYLNRPCLSQKCEGDMLCIYFLVFPCSIIHVTCTCTVLNRERVKNTTSKSVIKSSSNICERI